MRVGVYSVVVPFRLLLKAFLSHFFYSGGFMNIGERFSQFINDSKRIFIVSRKPTWDEYKRMMIIVALGIVVIGMIGYLITLFFSITGVGV
jgi:protein transport protein SEC61 subunit gamma-like protein